MDVEVQEGPYSCFQGAFLPARACANSLPIFLFWCPVPSFLHGGDGATAVEVALAYSPGFTLVMTSVVGSLDVTSPLFREQLLEKTNLKATSSTLITIL